jgi:hypothetical protein
MPGIDPSTFPADYAQTVASVATTVAASPRTTSEPPLACYVTATCPSGRAALSSDPAGRPPTPRALADPGFTAPLP